MLRACVRACVGVEKAKKKKKSTARCCHSRLIRDYYRDALKPLITHSHIVPLSLITKLKRRLQKVWKQIHSTFPTLPSAMLTATSRSEELRCDAPLRHLPLTLTSRMSLPLVMLSDPPCLARPVQHARTMARYLHRPSALITRVHPHPWRASICLVLPLPPPRCL